MLSATTTGTCLQFACRVRDEHPHRWRNLSNSPWTGSNGFLDSTAVGPHIVFKNRTKRRRRPTIGVQTQLHGEPDKLFR